MKFYTKLLFILFVVKSYSQISIVDIPNCIIDLDENYYYQESLSENDISDFSLNSINQERLREELTKQIVSFIRSKSTSSISFSNIEDNFSETEIFNSFTESESNAIIFNPSYSICKDETSSGFTYKAIVYINKEQFDNSAIVYFKSLIESLNYNLDVNKAFYLNNPNYEFTNELLSLQSGTKKLDSYFGLMVSLNIDQKILSSYFRLNAEVESFSNEINSLDNNIIRANSYIDESNFIDAYNLLINLDSKYPGNPIVDSNKNRYNNRVELARKERIIEYKNNSSSYNNFSIELGLNSALLNSYSGNSGTVSFNNNSYTDRFYTYLETRYTFNNRELDYGIGPYFKFHFSKLLFVLNEKEYFFPFSDSFSEIGIWGRYFIKNSEDDNVASISLGVGKLMENFVTQSGQKLSFNAFSPGVNFYLREKDPRSYKRSISFRFNIIHGEKQYSYSSFSFGYTFNFKSGRKISDDNRIKLDKDFKFLD